MLTLATMSRTAAGSGMLQPSSFDLQRECDRLAEHNAACAFISAYRQACMSGDRLWGDHTQSQPTRTHTLQPLQTKCTEALLT